MAHICWILLQSHHQSYSAMKAAPHQSAPSSVAPNTSSGRLWLLVGHLYEMKSGQKRDTGSDYSCKPPSPAPTRSRKSESVPASPSVWSLAEDAYLEARIRFLRSLIIEPIPRTRRRNRKSSPIVRAVKRRAYASARLCSKTIRTTARRLCRLWQWPRQWPYREDVMTYTQNANPPYQRKKLSHRVTKAMQIHDFSNLLTAILAVGDLVRHQRHHHLDASPGGCAEMFASRSISR